MCGKGVTTIIHCSQVSTQSIQTEDANEYWKLDCIVKRTLTRDNKIIHSMKNVPRAHLQKYADILIGHFPYGIYQNWINEKSGRAIVPQYVTFSVNL